jgi:hypothetical protein
VTPLLVLHGLGAEAGAKDWRATLDAGAWDGAWEAPDLPDVQFFDPADLVMVALQFLRDAAWDEPPVILAVGEQFAVAEVLALGERAASIVIVDAVPVVDLDVDECQRRIYEWLRGVADDPDAVHGLPPFMDSAFWQRQRAAINVPVLTLEGGDPASVLARVRAWWGDA